MADSALDTEAEERGGDRVRAQPSGPTTAVRGGGAMTRRSELVTDKGKTSIADSVVAKIAGLATREVPGVHDMGTGAFRALGTLREKLPIGSSEPSPTRGVNVEVGERQAAIDLDVVVDYGMSIIDVAAAIRRNVIEAVESMTGLEVVEVNVTVDDVYIGEVFGDGRGQSRESRVQ